MYFQLENLSRADPPYKSVAALNCIVLGCANIWDLDRAYQTFEAISSTFGLNPNIHSYNSLMYAFGKLKKVGILLLLCFSDSQLSHLPLVSTFCVFCIVNFYLSESLFSLLVFSVGVHIMHIGFAVFRVAVILLRPIFFHSQAI